ncbi:response regulator transcription factor RpaB [Spirulina sp. 06S082]|uniref:response regulator transcription factor RpaB n=1 Tax=Spirulina sp. 06S082 TaxID=3110248 RepID=UPI002B1F44C2|nr:response regulator [Spirulina sp. 06S082]MEA5469885.1 response regulator [Spirulina sp. 06S082]
MTDHKGKILVVDDEPAVRRILETRLTMVGYEVVTASDGEEALALFFQETPDLIILDVMIPNGDGYYTCQEIRKDSDVPIIMLTALADVADRITGLQIGADDYLVKPFSPKELEARIQTILRRVKKISWQNNEDDPNITQIGLLRIDPNKRRVSLGDRLIRLTEIEFNILQLLIAQSGKPISRAEILQAIWGYSPRQPGDLRLVDVHISRLRGKIETDPKQPEFIVTERGMGYSFQHLAVIASHQLPAMRPR